MAVFMNLDCGKTVNLEQISYFDYARNERGMPLHLLSGYDGPLSLITFTSGDVVGTTMAPDAIMDRIGGTRDERLYNHDRGRH